MPFGTEAEAGTGAAAFFALHPTRDQVLFGTVKLLCPPAGPTGCFISKLSGSCFPPQVPDAPSGSQSISQRHKW